MAPTPLQRIAELVFQRTVHACGKAEARREGMTGAVAEVVAAQWDVDGREIVRQALADVRADQDAAHPRPAPAELNRLSRELGDHIAKATPPRTGFLLLLFDFGIGGHLAWISNADRPDMLNTLKEFTVNIELDQAGGTPS